MHNKLQYQMISPTRIYLTDKRGAKQGEMAHDNYDQ